ncbi:MAG: diphosphomevalonate decarboxylase [Myxococcota bacterium]
MTKQQIVQALLGQRTKWPTTKQLAAKQQTIHSFAHANIALCKYWGKRDRQLNLPVTSSLSICLGTLGSHVQLRVRADADRIQLNDQTLPPDHVAYERITTFLDLFRPPFFDLQITNTIPTAAGFASSASLFAALVKALNTLFAWQLPVHKLCILARLGSGSACRSLHKGFVLWHAGKRSDGMDSVAEGLSTTWPDLRLGLLVTSRKPKAISSREAMQHTVDTSPLYSCWPQVVQHDLACLQQAITQRDFHTLGQVSQANALAMHATMLAARPSVLYWLPDSVKQIHAVWQAHRQGLPLYFTMDAGANLKLLFLQQDEQAVCKLFKELHVVSPWDENRELF